ncbi:hypothetical protein EYC80_010231 [Monilinia laxa]|uniref:Phosphoglycerate mutase n=1 Tax=Monilinia laxa TaxID=61186 RepID=A0A5N6JN85_MONLA|nr:hypothetical protein EYC80_010231 [Monilinia laxa]
MGRPPAVIIVVRHGARLDQADNQWIRPALSTDSPRLAPLLETTNLASSSSGKTIGQTDNIKKSLVRVDAFLGEWLAPDYFEHITPPPSSIMMVAGAKADLLRREDYNSLIHVRDFTAQGSSFQPFPGGWGSPITTEKKEFPSVSSLSHALPRRDRTSSLSSVGSNGNRQGLRADGHLPTSEHGIYQPPVPSYAISTSDPIPPGYATHARDACVDVDYQWDSMREPLDWGNGGEYGEEWPSMHKRFRRGLHSMLDWYKRNENPGEMVTKTPSSPELENPFSIDGSHEEDTDIVLILVTHGAGCNALIGALTNQPLLMDVGMASLTMAVQKPFPETDPTFTPDATPNTHSRTNSRTLSLSEEYDLKLLANTEHLRSTTSSIASSRTPSAGNLSIFRERQPIDPNRSTINSSLGSIRRTASVASSQPRTFSSARQSSIGLWSATPPLRESFDENDDTDTDSMILNFGDDSANLKASVPSTAEEENTAAFAKNTEIETSALEEDEVAPLGLWGSPRLTASSGPAVDLDKAGHTTKRRWTVNERA